MLNRLMAIKGNKIAQHIERSDPTFIPVLLTGGIGDVIMALDALLEIQKTHRIMVYTKHFEAFRYFDKKIPLSLIMPAYTWHLEFNQVARFRFSDQFSGFLLSSHEDLFKQQQKLYKKDPKFKALSDAHPHQDFMLCQYARELGLNRRTLPVYSLGENIDFPETERFWSTKEKQITIHDGYDVSNAEQVDARATKQWKWSHWNALVKDLKKNYPKYTIIQLGAITGRDIDGVDSCLLNKTTITEAFDILGRSLLHIDGDSGLVHAATKMGVKVVAMFGPTPDYYFGYPQNINIRSTNPCQEACFWVKDNWMNKCPIGLPTPQCMDEITTDLVMEKIKSLGF